MRFTESKDEPISEFCLDGGILMETLGKIRRTNLRIEV
ncbi:hypothetical protein ES332_D11G187000v1 [Gossypium tomentosum]|uniref:Uncharacterized protein n=1 Tax=Gossypium tomentosum TaxID=34277 RepID=A0A5D2IQT7_GOSTO|nr:hypothetical protein ES332_D11G187000v1 [Gossypium tomentosum]